MVTLKSFLMQVLLGGQHFLVDAVCVACLFGPVKELCGNTPLGYSTFVAFIGIYNVLAFCTQWLTGLWSDSLKNDRIIHVVAAVMLVSGVACCRIRPLYGVVLIGLGNSLFHVAGGRYVILNSQGKAGALGLFVAPGALGLYIGGIFGEWDWIFCILLVINTAVICICLKEHILLEPEKHPLLKFDYLWAVILVLLCIVCRAASGAVSFPGKNIPEILAWLPPLMVFSGKAVGGFAGDRFGYTFIGIIAFSAGTLMLAFSSNLTGYVAGQFMVNLLMPLTLWQLTKLLPASPGLAFGLAATVLVPGTWIRFTVAPINIFLVLSAAALMCFIFVQLIIRREMT